MSKVKVIDKKSEKSINSERTFLSKLHHPFIVNMHYAFQDNDNLYLVMDMLSGGDLRYHIARHKKFSEEQTRFFIGCMVLALEYIHSANVIHRDIKPENLVLDEKGYVRVTDFGIAKENCADNSSETSGTPGYMSPEVMQALNHSFEVDFFALGVIGYEFMKGKRPYVGKNRKEIKEQIMSEQVQIKKDGIVVGWSEESAEFINGLLLRKPNQRLGFKTGVNELVEHSWLKYYPWIELREKKLPSPFIPEQKDNFDKRYCESIDVVGEDTKMRYEEILCDENEYLQSVFKHFFFNKDDIPLRKGKTIVTNSIVIRKTNEEPALEENINLQKDINTNNSNNQNENTGNVNAPSNKYKKGVVSFSHSSSKSNLTNYFHNNNNNNLINKKCVNSPSTHGTSALYPTHWIKDNNCKQFPQSPQSSREINNIIINNHLNKKNHNNHRQLSHSYSTKIIKPHNYNTQRLFSPHGNFLSKETKLLYLLLNNPSSLLKNKNKKELKHQLSRGNSTSKIQMKSPNKKIKRSASLVDTSNNREKYYLNKFSTNNKYFNSKYNKLSQGNNTIQHKKVNRIDHNDTISASKTLLRKLQSKNINTQKVNNHHNKYTHNSGKKSTVGMNVFVNK